MINALTTPATGTAKRDVAASVLEELAVRAPQITFGAAKAYDTRGFSAACRDMGVVPHVAQNVARIGGSAIKARTARHASRAVSQRNRKCIEQRFAWAKVIGPMHQVIVRGLCSVDQAFTQTMAAYNLSRLRSLPGLAA